MSSNWFADRFSDPDSPCMHLHVVEVSTGSRRFSQGEVTDDIQVRLLCTDCLEYVSEVEVRAGWSGKSLEELSDLLLGNEAEKKRIPTHVEVKG